VQTAMPLPRVFFDFVVGDRPLGRVVVSSSLLASSPQSLTVVLLVRAVQRCVSRLYLFGSPALTHLSVFKTTEKSVHR
jgi:hypothetical protein